MGVGHLQGNIDALINSCPGVENVELVNVNRVGLPFSLPLPPEFCEASKGREEPKNSALV